MRNLLLGVLLGAVVCAVLTTSSSEARIQTQQTTKEMPRMYYVTGTGWQTCGDWNDSNESFKIGYVIGHGESVSQVVQIIGDIPSARPVKESFDVPAGLKYGDEVKSLNVFCSDYRNVRIPLVNAIGIVLADLAGRPAHDDKSLRTFRCLAAAGIDEGRIKDCYTQQ
jgi:hypothetical protein